MAVKRPQYNPDYDDVLVMVNRDRKLLGLDPADSAEGVSTKPVVVGSFGAWKRAMHSPNAALIARCQEFWVHDVAERTTFADGRVVATCTCGLEVYMGVEEADGHEQYFPKYFAENRRKSIEWERAFFAARGHRDPFHKTVLGGYLIRVKGLEVGAAARLELQCQHCGWLGETDLGAQWDDFKRFHHRSYIDMHNWTCKGKGKGVEVFDDDVFLWGHDPLGALKSQRRREAEEAKKNGALPEPAELLKDDDEA